MFHTVLLILFLSASIMGQMTPPLNATVGGSVLISCVLPVSETKLSLRWFFWQEDNSDNILYHWDIDGNTRPVSDKYKNRCSAFSPEFSSGNISIRLDSVTVEDDQKIFWAFVRLYDEEKKVSKQPEQWCRSKLQVSAPYKDLQLTVNNTANSATCTARGGFPEAQVSWTGQNKSRAAQLDLQHAETFLQEDPTEKTFTVTSSVSVKELQSVTCYVYNPRSNRRIHSTSQIDAPGEDQQMGRWHIPVIVAVVIFIVSIIFILIILYKRRHERAMTSRSWHLSLKREEETSRNSGMTVYIRTRPEEKPSKPTSVLLYGLI